LYGGRATPPPDCVGTLTVVLCVTGVVPPAPVHVSVKVVVLLSDPVLALPLTGSVPDQPPEALQLAALLEVQLNVEAAPALTVTGVAVRLTVGPGTVGAVTVMLNGASELELTPSLTLRTMLA
jgi:hypothetical protein